ncbi:chloramphenicol acetyltransferase, partial [Enterococcus faecium]|uniref:chloramphenicol acetyltransferase n=1 Tax=Enterococcus faecium TaxID=1352 RepID=UPI00211C1F66
PENHLNISSLPWVSFDGFNLNITGNDDYFSPVFTMAKFQQEYQHDTRLFPQGNLPENHLNISSLPWVSFDGFNLNITGNDDYFSPV